MAKNCCILECVSKATILTTFNITLSRPRSEVKREFPLTAIFYKPSTSLSSKPGKSPAEESLLSKHTAEQITFCSSLQLLQLPQN